MDGLPCWNCIEFVVQKEVDHTSTGSLNVDMCTARVHGVTSHLCVRHVYLERKKAKQLNKAQAKSGLQVCSCGVLIKVHVLPL